MFGAGCSAVHTPASSRSMHRDWKGCRAIQTSNLHKAEAAALICTTSTAEQEKGEQVVRGNSGATPPAYTYRNWSQCPSAGRAFVPDFFSATAYCRSSTRRSSAVTKMTLVMPCMAGLKAGQIDAPRCRKLG